MKMNFETTETKSKISKGKLLLLTFGGAILIFIMIRAMNEGVQLQQQKDSSKASVSAKEVVPVAAMALQNEFAQNGDSATKKYKDKTVLVRGIIAEIDKYHSGESFII